ncbi:MAG: lysyl-tRNA synthetase class 2 [Pseudohongiellaceae bacterium]|jgi:lysyl-tRNA synthetase class 2
MTEPDQRRLTLRTHPDTQRIVAQRAALFAALRRQLTAAGMIEADVPVLLPFAGQEPHLRPPAVTLPGLPGPLWLQTSPELALKRLLCAGVSQVFSLGAAFRGGREELSVHHQPAFTMLEWYHPGEQLSELERDCLGLGEAAADALQVDAPPCGASLSIMEACDRWAGLDATALFDGDLPRFAALAREAGLERCREDDDTATLLGRVLVERIEAGLAELQGWVFLSGFPAALAALSRTDPNDPRVALRTEAYLGGVELANGYVELTDADEQQRRWWAEAAERGAEAPARDEQLLLDLRSAQLQPTVGMALGVDRLAMTLLGAESLGDVLPLSLSLES